MTSQKCELWELKSLRLHRFLLSLLWKQQKMNTQEMSVNDKF